METTAVVKFWLNLVCLDSLQSSVVFDKGVNHLALLTCMSIRQEQYLTDLLHCEIVWATSAVINIIYAD